MRARHIREELLDSLVRARIAERVVEIEEVAGRRLVQRALDVLPEECIKRVKALVSRSIRCLIFGYSRSAALVTGFQVLNLKGMIAQ